MEIEEFEEYEQISKVRHERDRYRKELLDTQRELDTTKRLLNLIEQIEGQSLAPPVWTQPQHAQERHGIATAIFSDWHLDEVVHPDQVDYLNSYNRKIAESRIERFFEKFIILARDYVSGVQYDGAVLLMGGDIFSGLIHEELRNTNEAELVESVVYWLDPVIAGIRMVLNEFGNLHMAGVVGNHGRLPHQHRSPAKFRAQSNVDWLFYKLIARELRGVDGFNFQIPNAADCLVNLYNHPILLTHGDQYRGGGGISGIFTPLSLGQHRKLARQQAAGAPYQTQAMGHWHNYIPAATKGIIVNGSGKGYDEYSFISNFSYEEAQQAFWVHTPEHGALTFHAPIFLQNREVEGW